MWYVYILDCKNNKSYIGCTDNLSERMVRHKKGNVAATKDLRPVKLRCYFVFRDKYMAYKFEKYLKSGSGRAFTKRHFTADHE